MTLPLMPPVVGKGISPADTVHNLGDGNLIVVGSLNDEVDMRVEYTESEEFEFVFLFIGG